MSVLVAVFSITAGLLYGAWVDGVGPLWLALALAGFAAGLAAALAWLHRRRQNAVHAA